MADPSYALEVDPGTALQFTLNPGDRSTIYCVMTLKHIGKTNDHIAFKVQTTQPRHYLVRPNQGIIAPGMSESVTILIVEKYKQTLLQSFAKLGQSALDDFGGKFLIKSCTVQQELADAYSSKKTEMALQNQFSIRNALVSKVPVPMLKELNNMWIVANTSDETPIHNKKLPVKFFVGADGKNSNDNGNGKDNDYHNNDDHEVPTSKNSTEEKTYRFDAFLTHNWGRDTKNRDNHERVVRFKKELQTHNDIENLWLDEERMTGDIVQQMTTGIEQSRLVIVFITQSYVNKVAGRGERRDNDNCLLEFKYAARKKGPSNLIVVVMEDSCSNPSEWDGPVGFYLGDHLYYSFQDDLDLERCANDVAIEMKRRMGRI
mmetsp:Transcript_27273/g.41043  ORF Transcript_27273/g.41043 Transcript_27273/m.41043 type:complete len:374 (-) Transcript_27273:139-1260(-)